MKRDVETPVNRDALLETLAAELALAAYHVALRTRRQAGGVRRRGAKQTKSAGSILALVLGGDVFRGRPGDWRPEATIRCWQCALRPSGWRSTTTGPAFMQTWGVLLSEHDHEKIEVRNATRRRRSADNSATRKHTDGRRDARCRRLDEPMGRRTTRPKGCSSTEPWRDDPRRRNIVTAGEVESGAAKVPVRRSRACPGQGFTGNDRGLVHEDANCGKLIVRVGV